MVPSIQSPITKQPPNPPGPHLRRRRAAPLLWTQQQPRQQSAQPPRTTLTIRRPTQLRHKPVTLLPNIQHRKVREHIERQAAAADGTFPVLAGGGGAVAGYGREGLRAVARRDDAGVVDLEAGLVDEGEERVKERVKDVEEVVEEIGGGGGYGVCRGGKDGVLEENGGGGVLRCAGVLEAGLVGLGSCIVGWMLLGAWCIGLRRSLVGIRSSSSRRPECHVRRWWEQVVWGEKLTSQFWPTDWEEARRDKGRRRIAGRRCMSTSYSDRVICLVLWLRLVFIGPGLETLRRSVNGRGYGKDKNSLQGSHYIQLTSSSACSQLGIRYREST